MAEVAMDTSCIGPMLRQAQLQECWITEDGECVWLWGNDLALLLTLDMDDRCPTCGQHMAGGERWAILVADTLARRFFRRGYS